MLAQLILEGLRQKLTYVFLVYGFSFFAIFLVLYGPLRRSENATYQRVFWMLAGFGVTKGLSVWADAVYLVVGSTLDLYGLTAHNLSVMLAVVANVFMLEFSVMLMTHRLPQRKIYEAFPIILFAGYLVLFLLGSIDAADARTMGRYTFGYNGGILTCVALAHFLQLQKGAKEGDVRRGIAGLALGFALYAVFDGIVARPILGMPVYVFRMFCAVIMAGSAALLREVLAVKKARKVDYV